jgi:hypothetical protein
LQGLRRFLLLHRRTADLHLADYCLLDGLA